MNSKAIFASLLLLSVADTAYAKDNKDTKNDSNTPLHMLAPDYKLGYGITSSEDIKNDIDRVLHYLQKCTPARVVDKDNGKEITDYSKINATSQIENGDFRLTSYEWGVTYSAMLAAAEATGDKAYSDYAYDRLGLLAKTLPFFKASYLKYGKTDSKVYGLINPKALDDCGALCAAMIKAMKKNPELGLDSIIENSYNFISKREYRLADGTFARNRPLPNTLWLDDMFMGIPSVALMGNYNKTRQNACYSETVRQITQFAQRMFVPEKGLFRHGWTEGTTDHPAFFWGRANGWAMLTMCEVLDVLPADYPGREKIMELFRAHVRGITALQGKDGFWHQLLDRNDSYYETSATAIYVYCLAHGINKGWLDTMAYGPAAMLGWKAIASAINDKGQVEGVCVGTGMAFDPAFYYYRPVNVYAAHGYGPVIWAGAELIKLLKHWHPRMNDSAVHFYPSEPETDAPIFYFKGKGYGTNGADM